MQRLDPVFSVFFTLPLLLVLLLPASSCKKTATPAGPRACTADADCTISCESRTTCCNHPYCESAQHGEDAREIAEENRKRCTKKDFEACPAVGARMEVDYRVVPKCNASACVAEKVAK